MQLKAEISYEADPAAVFAMLVDPGFQRRRALGSGAQQAEVEVRRPEGGRDGALITVRRHLPAEILPAQLRGRVGSRLTLVQVEDWGPAQVDGSRTATLRGDVVGVPVELTGMLSLVPAAGGSRQSLDATVRARVPFIGGWIESGAAPIIRNTFEAEGRIGQQWLAAH